MYAVVSSCIGTVKLMRLIPIVLAGVVLSGRGLNLLVEPWFWIALMLALAFAGTLARPVHLKIPDLDRIEAPFNN